MQKFKQITHKLIEKLPDDVSLDDIMEALRVQKKILTGREQIHAGMGITHEEAKRRLEKWLK